MRDETSIIRVIVRLPSSGEEFDVELPLYTTGKEIVEGLLDANLAPRTDSQGNLYTYRLMSKDIGLEVVPEKTLFDLGVKDGHILLLTPRFGPASGIA